MDIAKSMQGPGYLISDEGKLVMDNVFDYDSQEYLEEGLQGVNKILKGISSLMKGKIGVDAFIDVYEYIKNREQEYLDIYTEEGFKLAGLNKEDIEK